MSQCRAAAEIVHPSAERIVPTSICLPSGDGKTVQHGSGRHVAAGDHMVGVVAYDVGGCDDHAICIGNIIAADIAAQHGGEGIPITLSELVRAAGRVEATVKFHFIQQLESVTDGCAWSIDPGGHPNFVAAGDHSHSKGILQICVGIRPTAAV